MLLSLCAGGSSVPEPVPPECVDVGGRALPAKSSISFPWNLYPSSPYRNPPAQNLLSLRERSCVCLCTQPPGLPSTPSVELSSFLCSRGPRPYCTGLVCRARSPGGQELLGQTPCVHLCITSSFSSHPSACRSVDLTRQCRTKGGRRKGRQWGRRERGKEKRREK